MILAPASSCPSVLARVMIGETALTIASPSFFVCGSRRIVETNVGIQRTPKAFRSNDGLCRIPTALLELLEAVSIGKKVIENGVGELDCVLRIGLGNRDVYAMRGLVANHSESV